MIVYSRFKAPDGDYNHGLAKVVLQVYRGREKGRPSIEEMRVRETVSEALRQNEVNSNSDDGRGWCFSRIQYESDRIILLRRPMLRRDLEGSTHYFFYQGTLLRETYDAMLVRLKSQQDVHIWHDDSDLAFPPDLAQTLRLEKLPFRDGDI